LVTEPVSKPIDSPTGHTGVVLKTFNDLIGFSYSLTDRSWDLRDFLVLGARPRKPDTPNVRLAKNPLVASAE
jgi:hypothetical protein